MDDIIAYFTSGTFIGSVIIVVIALVVLHVIKKYLVKKVAYSGKDEQHKNTFIGIVFSVLQYMVILIAVIVVMRLHGVNPISIVTGLGIVATIIGLSLQDMLKDIIAGINIYNSNFYKVGDMVRWNGEECDVKYFSARVTKFQSIYTNSTYTVCNSQITSIEKIKDTKMIMLEFHFEDDPKAVNAALDKACKRAESIDYMKEVINLGLIDFSTQGVTYGILYKCPAHKNLFIRIDVIRCIYEELINAGLTLNLNLDVDVNMAGSLETIVNNNNNS